MMLVGASLNSFGDTLESRSGVKSAVLFLNLLNKVNDRAVFFTISSGHYRY